MAKLPKLGSGKRFQNLKVKLGHKKGITNPGALAASIGRKKYGAKKFASLAAHGKKGRKYRSKKNDKDADDVVKRRRRAGVSLGLPSNQSDPQVSPLPLQQAPNAPTGARKVRKAKGFRVGPLKTQDRLVSPILRLKNAMGKLARQ